MSEDILNAGEEVTFRELFRRHAIVEIPLVQRDYAQGRSGEQDVRDEFLEALFAALMKQADDPSLPLNLDFVYGSVEPDGRGAFEPLDGQQRLTTLYLLHWYLAWRDGALADFLSFIQLGDHSRFSYAIRPSSKEFFDALLSWKPDAWPGIDTRLSSVLVEQAWFFRSWQLDPTIQSALAMLDAIDQKFGASIGLYDRLVNDDAPRITMHLLDLKSFGLSDDLYIKMNARGKPLTPFENFKARLEQHLGAAFADEARMLHGQPTTLRHYFSHRIDTVWADVFWHYRDRRSSLFDDRVMNLVQVLVIVTRNPDARGSEALLTLLRSTDRPFSFRRFQDHGCLDRPFIETLVAVLDAWSGAPHGIRPTLGENPYYDEVATFERAVNDCTQLTYTQLIQFHAYCAFIHRYPEHICTGRFIDWMRIIVNLSENTPYDNVDALRRSIAGVNAMLAHAATIVEHFASRLFEVPGFTVQQVREEQLKAQLFKRAEAWRDRILRAETHQYFKGQVEFLFKFCGVLEAWTAAGGCGWSDASDVAYQQKFDDYHARATTVFGGSGLQFYADALWERALLSIGNYLMPIGSNWHFGDAASRDTSWKRLLRSNASDTGIDAARRMFVRTLLDEIVPGDPDVAATLSQVIDRAPPTGDWREPFIRSPALIDYCKHRMIRFLSPENIYLLSRKRMSSDHVEPFTYYLYLTDLLPMAARSELHPFGAPRYRSVNTDDEEPCIELPCHTDGFEGTMRIHAASGGFRLRVAIDPSKQSAPAMIMFAGAGGFDMVADHLSRQIAREGAPEALAGIAAILQEAMRKF
jgi:hypothetical protein